jgi:hypothetical protein
VTSGSGEPKGEERGALQAAPASTRRSAQRRQPSWAGARPRVTRLPFSALWPPDMASRDQVSLYHEML